MCTLLGLQLRFPQKVLLQMNTVRLPALFTPSQQQPLLLLHSRPLRIRCSSQNGAILSEKKKGPIIAELPLEQIRRPLLRTRNNNPEKVQQLMDSIADIGLQEPVFLGVTGTKHIKNLGFLLYVARSGEELKRLSGTIYAEEASDFGHHYRFCT